MTKNQQPLLGIFWVFKGKLLKAETLLKDGIEDAEVINAKHDHVSFWRVFRYRVPGLRKLEYEQVPRGRVLFMKTPKKFCVYMDQTLHRPAIKKLILAQFHLPKTRTTFLTDSHYTTDPEELERMFWRDRM